MKVILQRKGLVYQRRNMTASKNINFPSSSLGKIMLAVQIGFVIIEPLKSYRVFGAEI